MTRRYFDLAAPGYSFAEYARARGFLVVSLDHPGTGGSDAPGDGWTLTPAAIATTEAAAVSRVLAMLRAGTVPGVPALGTHAPVIGVGHSAGAHLLIQQYGLRVQDNSKINGIPGPNGASYPPTALPVSRPRYVGLALLGWAGHGLPQYLDAADRRIGELEAADPEAFARELAASARRRFGDPLATGRGGSAQLLIKNPMSDEVRQAMLDAQAPLLALAGHASMIPGTARRASAAIDVPVFLGVGEHDIAIDHHRIPGQFPAARDVTLYVLPGAGHNHNVEPGRQQLWERILSWAGQLADRK
jgi:alpha-beta hydrolase superfamily lysophospholipase